MLENPTTKLLRLLMHERGMKQILTSLIELTSDQCSRLTVSESYMSRLRDGFIEILETYEARYEYEIDGEHPNAEE